MKSELSVSKHDRPVSVTVPFASIRKPPNVAVWLVPQGISYAVHYGEAEACAHWKQI